MAWHARVVTKRPARPSRRRRAEEFLRGEKAGITFFHFMWRAARGIRDARPACPRIYRKRLLAA